MTHLLINAFQMQTYLENSSSKSSFDAESAPVAITAQLSESARAELQEKQTKIINKQL